MKIEVSVGEIIDKLSILKIKKQNITDIEKLKNIETEFEYLSNVVFNDLKISNDDFLEILEVNLKLWHIEDDIREKENNKEFDSQFIELARSVYITNDLRANIKKKLNIKYGSKLIEEKSYSKY